MAPRRRSEVYRLAVGLAALGLFAATFHRLRAEPADWWLIASLALAAALALSIGGFSAGPGLAGPQPALFLIAAAAVMYVANLFLVALAIALATSRSPVPLFLNTQRLVYVQFASLYVIGAVAAFT